LKRLTTTWAGPDEEIAGGLARVTYLIEPYQDIVRLTVRHENLVDQGQYNGVAAGWPAVLANLKSLLETGQVLPQSPWEMHAAQR
jgi:Activator of Hsp90 ATPase homolog 1-like protein